MLKKYLCDQMCSLLGRYLRAAGYDAVIIDCPMDDRSIFQMAVKDQRKLLTRDKFLKNMDSDGETIVLLKGGSLDEWADQLKNEEGVDWVYRPFTRCLDCNCIFEKGSSTDAPVSVRERISEFWICPQCKKTFWLGSHTDRMLKKLKEWQTRIKKNI